MSKILILVLFIGLLSACDKMLSTDQSTPEELQVIPFSEPTLVQFSWQLIEATDAHHQHIDALFLPQNPDQPITLKFADQILYIDHLFCNINSLGIYFKDKHLHIKQPIVTTMMGCPDDITLRESTMIEGILMNNPTLYLQSRKGQLQLIIETQKKRN